MRISDWSSDVCSSDLESLAVYEAHEQLLTALGRRWDDFREMPVDWTAHPQTRLCAQSIRRFVADELAGEPLWAVKEPRLCRLLPLRSEEHTSELQSLMRISYAVFCLKKKTNINNNTNNRHTTKTIY